jgi:Tfp pilus assembly protein PilN
MTITEVLNKIKSFSAKTTEMTTRLSRFLWHLLSFSLADPRIAPAQCLTVELSTGHISVVYAFRFLSRIKIMGIKDYPFEEGKILTPENLASTIVLAISDLKVPRVPITLVVPKAWVIMKTAEFPLAVKNNLSAVVSYELDRLTPLTADDSFYDFRIITEDKNRLKIMLTAMNSDILQPYLKACKEREINIERLTVSISAFATLSHYIQRRGSAIFITVDRTCYEAGLVSNGLLHCILGESFPSGCETSRESIISGAINPLVDMIKKEGKSSHVIFHDPFRGQWCLNLKDMIRTQVRFIQEIDLGIRYSKKINPQKVSYVALGGALECLLPAGTGINLLNRGIHKSSSTPVLPSIILLLLLAVLGLFLIMSPLQIEEKRLEILDRQIAGRKEEVKKVEGLKKDMENLEKEISTIGSFKTSRPMALILLKETTRILPKNAWLSRVRIAESSVEIEGYAASATELLPKLEASPYFEKVDFASPTFRDTRMNADRFTIKMELEGLAKEGTGHGKQK